MCKLEIHRVGGNDKGMGPKSIRSMDGCSEKPSVVKKLK